MFLQSPTSSSRSAITQSDLDEAAKLIDTHKLAYFTHSPYLINLSKDTEWGINVLIHELQITRTIHGKGVVVHVGKSVKLHPSTALDRMEESIRKCLPSATEECPLLLETPAGQGTELCKKIEDFMAFYRRFSDTERKIFKVCVDTCHVFATGYDPLTYLQMWEAEFGPDSVSVVHFNDSKEPCGSCKDRHAFMGSGHIGLVKLGQVFDWCMERNIPMIIE